MRTAAAWVLTLVLGAACGCATTGDIRFGEPQTAQHGIAPNYDPGTPGGETWPGHRSPGDWSHRMSLPIEIAP